MKKQISVLCLFLSVVLLFSCGKNSTPTAPFNYALNNVQDKTLSSNGTVTMTVATTLLAGNSEAVNLVVKGMPANTSITPSTISGIPTFNADFVITSNGAAGGTYPITIEATSASTEKKTYNFNLIVQQPPTPTDCASQLVGSYTGPENCTVGSENYTFYIEEVSTANRVLIKNLYNGGVNVYADIDCTAKTLTIPTQTVMGGGSTEVTVSGTGTFTSTAINVAYSFHVTSTGVDQSCTINGTKN